MRLNFAKYHVQDRNYSRAEVLSLINDDSNKHLALSGSNHSYSNGSILEATSYIVAPIILIATIGCAIYLAFNSENNHSYNYNDTGNNYNYINNYNKTNNNYKITDIPNSYYTGREVTKFMNEYYNYSLHFNSNIHYDNIVDDFLNHNYKEAEVPTLGNSSLFDIAVLDIY